MARKESGQTAQRARLWTATAGLSLAALCGSLYAQPSPPAPLPSNPGPVTDAADSTDNKSNNNPKKPQRPSTALKPVEIRASSDTEQRRLSTAAKIIVGREDIELYGDTSMGELLKRLPGVTVQGRPGRGGAPRMRGLGSGYTQILIDGERVPRGFSLDDLSPEEIERIEILRAPTAETGARAIAGTINIITRGGYSKKINTLKLGLGLENGNAAPNIAWSRNDTLDNGMVYNFSVAADHNARSNDVVNTTLTENLADGSTVRQTEAVSSTGVRDGVHANVRLQWRGSGGDTFMLMPMLAATQNSGDRTTRITQTTTGNAAADLPYDTSTGSTDGRFSTVRLAGVWTHKMDDGANLRLSANMGQSAWTNDSTRQNTSATRGTVAISNQHSEQQDRTLSTQLKYSRTVAEEHSLVTGLEVESNRRSETATQLLNGESPLSDFDGNLSASSLRAALYVQDEWTVNPHWAAHAGLRWEGIATTGSTSTDAPNASNQSQVVTPLFHTVWRPDLASKDQVRLSLTRSYRSPNLQDLIARPSINGMFLNRGANDEVHPDRAGNAFLQPELASGIDLAFEHYVPGGGMLSANFFYRQIENLMRSQTTLETVSWADVPRWVARKQNIGNATTQGIELEAKFRLSEMFAGAPKIDVRSNLSLFRSRVDGINGPDNRLDQQPDGTANLGADYQMTSLPLKVGGNINWTPQFATRLSDDQTVYQSNKLVADAYALWTINPRYQLRVSVSNFAGRDYTTGGSLLSTNAQGQTLRETTQTIAPSFVNLQARLEIKL
ncbi:MAG: TonB-dependent receptor [Pseudomonadota bacterium]